MSSSSSELRVAAGRAEGEGGRARRDAVLIAIERSLWNSARRPVCCSRRLLLEACGTTTTRTATQQRHRGRLGAEMAEEDEGEV
eukprot:874566-Rhodomonas_salina.1